MAVSVLQYPYLICDRNIARNVDLLLDDIISPSTSNKWRELGKMLNYTDQELDRIRTECQQRTERKCLERILQRIKDPPAPRIFGYDVYYGGYISGGYGKVTFSDASLIIAALKEIGEEDWAKKLGHTSCDSYEQLLWYIPSTKWREFGLQLGLSDKDLIDISTTSSNELCLEQLLRDWVKEENDAKKLIDAFEVLGFHIDARRMSQLFPLRYGPNAMRQKMLKQLRDDYERAIKDGSDEVTYVRVMFIGPSGVGKSSLLRGLMGKKLEAANSTVLADTYHLKNTWAKTDFSSKWCNVTEDDEIHELAVLLHKTKKQGFETRSLVNPYPPPPPVPWKVPLCDIPESHGGGRSVPVRKLAQCPIPDSDFLGKARGIRHVVQSEVVEKAYNLSEREDFQVTNSTPEVLLHVWDCGGQPVYLDTLQPFLSSHTMFFLLYNAADGLDSTVKSVWYKNGEKTEHGNLEVTVLDQLQQWMAAIHASLFMKENVLSCTAEALPPYPRIMLAGTHGDLLEEDNCKQVLDTLESQYEGKAFSKLLVDSIILDNTKAGEVDDKPFMKVRETVQKFSSENLTVKTPVAWVLFRKMLSEAKRSPIVAFEEVLAVAELCNIQEEVVPSVLSFYHELGVFLYYPDVQGLGKVVFADPQWLVKQIGKLLTVETKKGYSRQEVVRILVKYGILVEPLYNKVWKGCGVKPQAFVSLLEHYLLLVPSKTPPSISAFEGRSYFIPAMLPLYKESNATLHLAAVQSTDILCLTFNTKYLPPGFFVRLVAVLATNENCDIMFDRNLFRNSVCFSYHEKTIVNLTAKSTHVEITVTREVTRQHKSKLFVNICQDLLALVRDSSLKVLDLFSGIRIAPALKCSCQKSNCCFIKLFDHCQTALKSNECLQCVRGRNCYAKPDQQFWLTIPDVKEGCDVELSSAELRKMVIELPMEDCNKLLKAVEAANVYSEMSCKEEVVIELEQWSEEMKERGRQLLIYHLNRLGMRHIANKVYNEYYKRDVPPLPSQPSQVHGGSSLPELELKDLVLLDTSNWYILGLQLDIKPSKLHEIKQQSNNDIPTAKCLMFEHWLQIETCTNKHEKLIKASELVDGQKVAEKIAIKLKLMKK